MHFLLRESAIWKVSTCSLYLPQIYSFWKKSGLRKMSGLTLIHSFSESERTQLFHPIACTQTPCYKNMFFARRRQFFLIFRVSTTISPLGFEAFLRKPDFFRKYFRDGWFFCRFFFHLKWKNLMPVETGFEIINCSKFIGAVLEHTMNKKQSIRWLTWRAPAQSGWNAEK